MSKDSLSDEDKLLFREMMRAVKPLAKKDKVSSRVDPPKSVVQARQPIPPIIEKNYGLSDHYQGNVGAETILSYQQTGVPNKRFSELKKGQISWQARLDLHGFNSDSACNSLCRFVEQQYTLQHRCLLIIHGKGGLRGEIPVLKNLVNHWLRQLPQIIAFHSALARDGGNGAVYVLLKRQRPV